MKVMCMTDSLAGFVKRNIYDVIDFNVYHFVLSDEAETIRTAEKGYFDVVQEDGYMYELKENPNDRLEALETAVNQLIGAKVDGEEPIEEFVNEVLSRLFKKYQLQEMRAEMEKEFSKFGDIKITVFDLKIKTRPIFKFEKGED